MAQRFARHSYLVRRKALSPLAWGSEVNRGVLISAISHEPYALLAHEIGFTGFESKAGEGGQHLDKGVIA